MAAAFSPNTLRELMKQHGFDTTFALSKAARLHHAVLYEYLSGKSRSLSLGSMQKLAAVFPGSAFALAIAQLSAEPVERAS